MEVLLNLNPTLNKIELHTPEALQHDFEVLVAMRDMQQVKCPKRFPFLSDFSALSTAVFSESHLFSHCRAIQF